MRFRTSEVAALPASNKRYLWTMDSHGLEFGHGTAGTYPAHAHTKVIDVVFAAGGMTVAGTLARLCVVLPNTIFGPVGTGPFWFLKFFPARCEPTMPDKTDAAPAHTGLQGILLAGYDAEIHFDLFDPRTGTMSDISLSLTDRTLSVTSPLVGQVILE
jgi:hypothetical protein